MTQRVGCLLSSADFCGADRAVNNLIICSARGAGCGNIVFDNGSAVFMTERIGIIVNICIGATRTGVGRVTLLSAGRLGNYRAVIVTECIGVIVNICIGATGAGIGRVTLLCAGRCSNYRAVIVAERGYIGYLGIRIRLAVELCGESMCNAALISAVG